MLPNIHFNSMWLIASTFSMLKLLFNLTFYVITVHFLPPSYFWIFGTILVLKLLIVKVRRRDEILKIWIHTVGWTSIKNNNRMWWVVRSLSHFGETRVEIIWRDTIKRGGNQNKTPENLKGPVILQNSVSLYLMRNESD